MDNDPEKSLSPARSAITDLLGVGWVADKLVNMVERGIGPVTRPLLDSWANRRIRSDASQQLTELRKEGLVPASAELTIDGRASLRVEMKQQREQANCEAIAAASIPVAARLIEAKDETKPNEGVEIELEWLDHFWELAGRISSEGRQQLWAKILARAAIGHVTSARTLTLLSTLSADEARQLENLARAFIQFHRRETLVDEFGYLTSLPSHASNKDEADKARLARIEGRLRDACGTLDRSLFGSVGVLVENGWAFSMSTLPKDGNLYFKVAGQEVMARGARNPIVARPENYGFVYIGSGIEISPIGRELLGLVSVDPNEEWLSVLAAGYDHIGWELLRVDGTKVPVATID